MRSTAPEPVLPRHPLDQVDGRGRYLRCTLLRSRLPSAEPSEPGSVSEEACRAERGVGRYARLVVSAAKNTSARRSSRSASDLATILSRAVEAAQPAVEAQEHQARCRVHD